MKSLLCLRYTLLAAAVLFAGAPACSRKEPEAAAPPPAAPPAASQLETSLGFMSRMPQDVEAFAAAYNSRSVWQRFFGTKAYAAIRASGLFDHPDGSLAAAGPALNFLSPDAKKTVSDQLVTLRHIAGDALGAEYFVSFANGSTQDIATWRQFLAEIQTQQRISQFKTMAGSLGGAKPNANWAADAMPALAPYIQSLQIPPMVFGFKMSTQKPALQQEIDTLAAKLPKGVAVTSFNLGDKPFTSWTFVAGSLIPQDKQDSMRAGLEKISQDKAAADGWMQALLARKAEVAFGYVGDYFLVSVGPDHSHLKLADSPANSLVSRPEMSVLAPYAGKRIWGVQWTAQKFLETLSQRDMSMLPVFESIKPSLAATMSPQDIEQTEANLRRIDAKGKNLLSPTVTQAAVAVSYWEDGLHLEQYGGVLMAGLATGKPLVMNATDLPSNFLWADSQMDPAFRDGMMDWLTDLTKAALDLYHRAVLPKLNSQQQPGFAMAEALVLPKLKDLFHITRDQFLKSLGTESAVALDLNGAVPPVPSVPPAIQSAGKIPRVAFVRDISDPKLLGQAWESYLAEARQISAFFPPKMQVPGGLPEPQIKDLGGSEMYYYAAPMDTGDFLPNVTIAGGKDFVFSTSPAYASDICTALKGAAGDAAALKIDVRLTPAYDFAEAWFNLAGEHPDLFFREKPDAAARFVNNLPKILDILKGLRIFRGFETRLFMENGGLRATAVFHIHDID